MRPTWPRNEDSSDRAADVDACGQRMGARDQYSGFRGPGQWVLDVIWQRREFAGGRLQPPEPELLPAIPHQREIYVLGRVQ